MVSPNLIDAQRLSDATGKKTKVLRGNTKLRILSKVGKKEPQPRSGADKRQAMYGKGS